MAYPASLVSVRHWRVFDELEAVLAACLDDVGGLAGKVRPGDLVVIKPNLTANAPASSGGTTHVELVAALIGLLRPCQPGRIVVAEGTGRFGPIMETAFPTGGWREMAAELGVELVNLDSGPHDEIKWRRPLSRQQPFSRLIPRRTCQSLSLPQDPYLGPTTRWPTRTAMPTRRNEALEIPPTVPAGRGAVG
jgi:uncharacterized protein (DUF362 family)